MSFTLAALIIAAVLAVALGLACYSLLVRLDGLERAVHGGLTSPTRRLAREEFEQRFARAVARAALARRVEHGVVLVVGAEFPGGELESALQHLGRGDAVHLACAHDQAAPAVAALLDAGIVDLGRVDAALGVGVTPFVLVVDDRRVTIARPVASGADLVDLLAANT